MENKKNDEENGDENSQGDSLVEENATTKKREEKDDPKEVTFADKGGKIEADFHQHLNSFWSWIHHLKLFHEILVIPDNDRS